MSLPIDIRIRKGTYTKEVQHLMSLAIKEAWADLWKEYERKIAKKSGRLRAAVKGMVRSQLLGLNNRRRLTIKFLALSGPPWNIYHIFGPEGEAPTDAPYKDPTTKNTRPLNEFIFMDRLHDLILKNLSLEFSSAGLKWKRYVKVI